jgi:hypothetical protein
MKGKNLLLVAVAVVCLVTAAIIHFYPWKMAAKHPDRIRIHGVCLETKRDVVVTAPIGESAPYLNPQTGKRTVYGWYFCGDCRHRFVPGRRPTTAPAPSTLPVATALRPAGIPVCPLCGGANCGAWNPDDPDQAHPAGDAPLPAKPG